MTRLMPSSQPIQSVPSSDLPQAQVRYARVAVDVPISLADDVSYELMELGASGVETRDDTTLLRAKVSGTVMLLASFENEDDAARVCESLEKQWNPRRDDVVGEEWREGWKDHFRPFALTEQIVVCPPWKIETHPGKHVIVIDPGRAFGTGLHATTRLVARAIEQLDVTGLHVLDVGCGSGLLGFCALVLGAAQVRALDNDAQAVLSTNENAARNGLAARVHADTTDVSCIKQRYPLVVANIETRVLIPMAEALMRCVDGPCYEVPGQQDGPTPSGDGDGQITGRLILSGILHDQQQDVIRAYAPMRCIAVTQDSDWVALEFVRLT